MRYRAILDHGRVQFIDTIRPITHAAIGQRNEEAERPEHFKKEKVELEGGETRWLANDEQEANAQHRARINSGHYNMGVLDWFESEQDAELAAAQWADLINVRIVPVTRSANG